LRHSFRHSLRLLSTMPCCALAGQQRKGKVAAYLGVSRGVTRGVDRPDTRGVPCAEARGVPCAVLPPASPPAVGSLSCSSCDMGSTCCFKSSASSLACPAVTADVACTVAAGHNSVQRRDSKRLPPLALMLLDNTLAACRERESACAFYSGIFKMMSARNKNYRGQVEGRRHSRWHLRNRREHCLGPCGRSARWATWCLPCCCLGLLSWRRRNNGQHCVVVIFVCSCRSKLGSLRHRFERRAGACPRQRCRQRKYCSERARGK